MQPLLNFDSVTAGYGRAVVLEGVTLEVNEGEVVALLGANGAGKTTLLRTASGMLRATAGSIRVGGVDAARLSSHQIARSGVAQVPEGRGVFPGLTVEENLRLGTFAARDGEAGGWKESAFELFPWMKNRARQVAGTLSGGEQQMLAIARALVAQPRLLLLDEPSLGLSPRIVEEVFRTLQAIRSRGVAILLAEQNVRRALDLADRGYVLNAGRVALEGTVDRLRDGASYYEAYMLGAGDARP